jgi:beta-lactam-binding protein with PASTA domain
MNCERCGQANEPGTVFCRNPSCNAYLDWSSAPTTLNAALPPTAPLPAVPLRGGPPPPPPPPPITPPTSVVPPPPPTTGATPAVPRDRGGIATVLTPSELVVQPGSVVLATLRIRNTGSIVDNVSVTVPDLPPDWVTIEPAALNLYVDDDAEVHVRVAPPRVPSTAPGRRTFNVVASSSLDASVRATQSGALEVGRFDDLVAQLTPPESEGKKLGEHRLLLANRGNVARNVAISATDRSEQVRFGLPPTVELAPGADLTVPLQALPRRRLWIGQPKRHAFSVEIDGKPHTQTQGTYTQIARLPKWLLPVAAAVLAVLLALGVPLLLRQLSKSDANQPVAVPNLSGLTLDQAQGQLTALKLRVETGATIPDQPEGRVARQEPAAGQEVKPDSTVRVFLGAGSVVAVVVPALEGLDFANAQATLLSKGLVAEKDTRTVESANPDRVVEVSPPAGQSVTKGSTVKLVMSVAIGKQTMPFLLGLAPADATTALTQQGFQKVEVAAAKVASTEYAAGSVAQTIPAAGTDFEKNKPVTLVLSSGPPLKDIPPVIGATPADATTDLKAAGFLVQSAAVNRDVTGDNTKIGKVLEVTGTGLAKGATKAPLGTQLQLVVGVGTKKVKVPALANKTEAEATAALQAAGLTITKTTAPSKTVAAGRVISTNPAANSDLLEGAAVALEVSSGPPVAVPNVVGRTIAQAKAALTAVNLRATVQTGCTDAEVVVGQSPGPTTSGSSGGGPTTTIVTEVARDSEVAIRCKAFFISPDIVLKVPTDISKIVVTTVKT